MEVITMEAAAYKEIVAKINTIAKFVVEHQTVETKNPDEEWVDSYEVCTFLQISQRTLQRLRSSGIISYSLISGKTYYTIGEIKRMLNERRVRSTKEALQNLIDNHYHYAQQRRVAKENK
ncbi:MAG: helix-turn-helix domain-containing protein [Bacteroidota bacterium]|nr:helix-turn-helix domain-containing protein [Bacteroidota bacterium]MDP4268503.1 helix-turn-helix domain-containing protein [Bacteroidota bacterium]